MIGFLCICICIYNCTHNCVHNCIIIVIYNISYCNCIHKCKYKCIRICIILVGLTNVNTNVRTYVYYKSKVTFVRTIARTNVITYVN